MKASFAPALAVCFVAVSAIAYPVWRNQLPFGRGSDVRHVAPKRARAWAAKRPSPDALKERVRIAAEESRKWAGRSALAQPASQLGLQQALSAATAVSGTSWVSLGPTDARFEWNGVTFTEVDSGRASGIQVDPRDPNVVYLATAGGGVWKTWNFVDGAPDPSWRPITDMLGNLVTNALELDRSNPDTIYVGTGDALPCYSCQALFGNSIFKSTDGGATWNAPVILSGTYPAGSGGMAANPLAVRDVKVDPANSSIVFAATDVGLFRSADGGESFGLVDLPNAGSIQVAESAWSIAFLGVTQTGSRWAVSGVYACDHGFLPPWPQNGVAAGATSYMKIGGGSGPCTIGNLGDIWISSDSGATWSSRRAAAGTFPTIPAGEIGRIALAAGSTATASSTVVYAQLADITGLQHGQGVWHSTDGGSTWQDATGTLANPTVPLTGWPPCSDTDLPHTQGDYNLAVTVDPTDPSHVLIGGNFCAARTLNGLASNPTWENIAHWLPASGSGNVTGGPLPYVHADWHAALTSTVGGKLRVFAGTDGGLFSSTNVFNSAVAPPQVVWDFHNRGLVTHMCNSIGSGDPATGNPFVIVTGLQDNGARFRDSTSSPTVFDQVIGGDGEGGSINKGTDGSFYWSGLDFGHFVCTPGANGFSADCLTPGEWLSFDPTLPGGDAFPFKTKYATLLTDLTGSGILTISDLRLWYWDDSLPDWQSRIAVSNTGPLNGLAAAPNMAGLWGVVTGGGYAAVSADAGTTWTLSKQLPAQLSAIAFPTTTPTGKLPGDVYVVASESWTDSTNALVPANVGHLFVTNDRGTTWFTLHGNGTGSDLPNVPIETVKFDPGDATNSTIYAGTDLGFYRTVDGGATWQRYGDGLPMVAVTDMYVARNSSLIRISTLGRGVWEIYPTDSPAKGVNGDGDFDRNQQIDWRDLAALASRLGTTPATTTWPTYNWTLDMTPGSSSPPVSKIDDADLTVLLAVFGSHP